MVTTFPQKCRAVFGYISKKTRWIIVGYVVGLFTVMAVTQLITVAYYDSQFRVIYSLDRRQNNQEIIRLINNAHRYVYFAIYYFTEKDIVQALIRAKKRDLIVWGITDAAASLDSNKNIIAELRMAGVTIETQKHLDGIMHIKALVTDNAYASGSYNWTNAATEANDEILEVGRNESVRRQYLSIIKKILITNE